MLAQCIESKFLTEEEVELIHNPLGEKTQKYISKYLTCSERRKIETGPQDEIILALIKAIRGHDPERFAKFNDWFPAPEYFKEYREGEIKWLKESKYYCEGDENRLLIEARENISPRYRAFFILKYPEKVHKDKE